MAKNEQRSTSKMSQGSVTYWFIWDDYIHMIFNTEINSTGWMSDNIL